MKIARVVGSAITTIQNDRIENTKMMICRESKENGEKFGKPYVAIDLVDAGVGDLVLTCHGSAARQTDVTKETPVDAVIMAVIDQLEVDKEIVYRM